MSHTLQCQVHSLISSVRMKEEMRQYRKATPGKDTEGQMLSKQFEFQWVQWESIGDPDKHLNCVM